MENEIFQIITNISWAGVGGLFVYYVLKPLVGIISVRINGKDNGNLRKKVEELENNHYKSLKEEVERLRGNIEGLGGRIRNLEIKVAKLEVRVNNKK